MNEIELILLLLVGVAAVTPLARAWRIPYPILLVAGGLILALIPGMPDVQLTPDMVFLVFLPPLVYRAAYTTSIRDFRAALKPILSLAVGLVLATMAVVAVLLHALRPDLGWPIAFAFGAIVAPPDAVAAAAVFQGLGVPRRVITLLEGEGLVNDATALVAYQAALGAVVVAFSAAEAGVRFIVVALGGLLVGLAIAWGIAWLLRRLHDSSVEITLSLLTPFATYLAAQALGLSGVLATVVAGLYLSWQAPYVWGSEERLRARAVWDMVDFILNGLVFILIGLQLSTILPTLAGEALWLILGLGLLVSAALILVRLVWIFLESYLPFAVARVRARRPRGPAERPPPAAPPNWRKTFVIGWAGMRGVLSLAAALALPEATPARNLLIFLTFFVILATLVGQGLSLPWLIRRLGVTEDSGALAHQERHARQIATAAALTQIAQLRAEWPAHLPLIDTLRTQYEHRASHLAHSHDGDSPADGIGVDSAPTAEESQELLEHHRIRRAVLGAERNAVLDLRRRGQIDDGVWRQIERDLDLEELRMDA